MDCDGIVLVTGHTPYRAAPVERFIQPGTVVLDNFGVWRGRAFSPGVRYHEIGRLIEQDGTLPAYAGEPSSAEVS